MSSRNPAIYDPHHGDPFNVIDRFSKPVTLKDEAAWGATAGLVRSPKGYPVYCNSHLLDLYRDDARQSVEAINQAVHHNPRTQLVELPYNDSTLWKSPDRVLPEPRSSLLLPICGVAFYRAYPDRVGYGIVTDGAGVAIINPRYYCYFRRRYPGGQYSKFSDYSIVYKDATGETIGVVMLIKPSSSFLRGVNAMSLSEFLGNTGLVQGQGDDPELLAVGRLPERVPGNGKADSIGVQLQLLTREEQRVAAMLIDEGRSVFTISGTRYEFPDTATARRVLLCGNLTMKAGISRDGYDHPVEGWTTK